MHKPEDKARYDAQFWNERYASQASLYGSEPNAFLAENIARLQGPVLSICEGEGRNAVFIASKGLQVLGVDYSDVALEKARALAQARGVGIVTEVADMAEYRPKENCYGAIISISAHLPSAVRARLYPLLERALVPGGLLLLEAYSEKQIARDTGGPKNIDMLMSVSKLQAELPHLKPLLIREIERDIHEGVGHTGLADVVQFIGVKPE